MPIQFSPEQKAVYRAAYAPNASNTLFDLFITECERRSLIPGKDVVFQTRNADEYSQELHKTVSVAKPVFITTIGALRLIAHRTSQMNGYGKFLWHYAKGDNGYDTFEFPQGRVPHAVTVEIYRKDWAHPARGVARFDAYVQKKTDGVVTKIWTVRGEEQLAKCAEALALRMLAPEEASGLLIDEELQNESREPATSPVGAGGLEPTITPVPVVIPAATHAPVVNQEAAPVAAPQTVLPQTSPFKEVAEATAHVPAGLESATIAPKQSRPAPPKTPPRPAPARPTAAPVVPEAPAAPVIPNRVPQPDRPAHESISEINAVADAVARDKDPVVADPTPAASPSPVPVADSPKQPATAVPPVAMAPTDDGKATREELAAFKSRAGKLMHDKLETQGGLKGASGLFRDFILKQGNAPSLEKIRKDKWEEILSLLEKLTPQEAANLVKENK